MCDNEPKMTPEEETEKPSYIPVSFEKRVIAGVGAVYMIMLVLATTYMIATASVLTNIAFLLLPPASVGVAMIAIHRYRKGELAQGRNFMLALVFLCFIAFVMGLVCGIPNLLAQLGALTL